jgi:hypothetical protein
MGDLVNRSFLIVFLTVLVISSLILVGSILVNLTEDEVGEGKFYTFPISVAEKTYLIGIRSNYTSPPEVSYFGLQKSVSIDFKGDPENAFCNITLPNDLIWGELTVIDKYYIMDKANYIQTSNSTDTSIYFTFTHTTHNALVKHFEIRGTEGVSEST